MWWFPFYYAQGTFARTRCTTTLLTEFVSSILNRFDNGLCRINKRLHNLNHFLDLHEQISFEAVPSMRWDQRAS